MEQLMAAAAASFGDRAGADGGGRVGAVSGVQKLLLMAGEGSCAPVLATPFAT
jgi:hypothetical protein